MAYTITVRIYQSDTSTFFPVVEKTVWNYANGGTWRENDGQHILTMGGSGTSGTLRFKSDTGEEVIFALGVHNFKPWCDAVPDAEGDTGMIVHAQYYNDGCRSFQREYQLTEWNSRGPGGRLFTVKYTVKGGHHLLTSVIIG